MINNLNDIMHINYRDRSVSEKYYKTARSYATTLFGASYVTGVSAIAKSKGIWRKIAKVLILGVCLAGFLSQTYYFLQLYWQYGTVSSVSRLHHVKKPAVTICDENLIRRIYFCENKFLLCEDFLNIEKQLNISVCNLYYAYCLDKFDMYTRMPVPLQTPIEYKDEYFDLRFIKEYGFQIYESVLSCEWFYNQGTQINISEGLLSSGCSMPQFVRGMNQEKLPGACYTLESAIGKWNYTAETIGYGMSKMVLKWRTPDLINLTPDVVSVTKVPLRVYYLSFHSPGELSNPFTTGFKIQERKEYRIRVSQVDHIRLPSPYSTDCFDYWDAWRKNGGNGPLKREDCQEQCEIEKNFRKYACVPREVTYPHVLPLCPDTKPYNLELTMEIQDCAEKCRDACFETNYVAKSEVVGQITVDEAVQQYGTPCVVKIEIDFDILKSVKTIYTPKYESVELFSYIGGYLGMWLGWSLLALFDFFEIVLRFIKYSCFNRRRKKIAKVKQFIVNY